MLFASSRWPEKCCDCSSCLIIWVISSLPKHVSDFFSVSSVANCSLYAATLSSPVDFNYDNALKISSVLSRGFSSRSVASLSFAHVSASRNVLHLHLDLLRILVSECRSPLEKKDVARFPDILLAPESAPDIL